MGKAKNTNTLLKILLGVIIISITLVLIFNKYGKETPKTELETYFDPNQIEELNKLTEFVIGQITNDCEGDQESCINKYFDRYNGYDYEITGISNSKQSELLNSLSPDVFDDIWGTCKGSGPNSKNSLIHFESLCPKTDGKFASFLKEYCATNNRLATYGNTFEMAGDFPPSMTVQLLENPSSFDLSSKEELLILSVHLLTLNQEVKIVDYESKN